MDNRTRLVLVAAARAQLENSTAQLEAALKNVIAAEISNPVIEELRDAVLAGRKMIARSHEIIKRIPGL